MTMDQYFLAVDVGGTKIKVLVVDAFMRPLAGIRAPSLPAANMDELMDRIFAAADAALNRAAGGRDWKILGIGVGFFGLIDGAGGTGIFSLRVDMSSYPIAERLSARYGAPVVIDNDAHVAVLGEMVSGAARGHRDVAQLNLGTSLASGFIIDGQVLRGRHNVAGELGHFTVQTEGGKLCFCGRSGCALNYVSGTAITQRFRQELRRRPDSVVWDWAERDPHQVHLAMLGKALDEADDAALATIEWSLSYLSTLVTSLIALFNPSIVVIGGGVSNLGDRLVSPLRERVGAGLLHPVQECEIVTAQLVQESGLAGALAMIVATHPGGDVRDLNGLGDGIHAVMEGASV